MPEDQVTTESLREVLFNLSRRIRDRIHSLARKTGINKPSPDQIQKLFEELQKSFYSAIYSTCINWLSLPAGVVPIGMIEGRPAGVQIIGRRFREDLILDAMQKIEDRVGVLTEELWNRPEMI